MLSRIRPPPATAGGRKNSTRETTYSESSAPITPPHASTEKGPHRLPQWRRTTGGKRTWVKKEGESGRSFFHPGYFFYLCFRSSSRLSMAVNVLWPVVPAAIAVHFALPGHHVTIFTLNFIAMVPAANLLGFAGQELGRKLPHVLGVLVETTFGSIVEIILFSVLVTKGYISVVKDAILGSLLANLLFCLGLCFIAGGLRESDQVFHSVVSEVGSGLMLVAGMALVLPAAFGFALESSNNGVVSGTEDLNRLANISRATAIVLMIAYAVYVFFNMASHHGLVSQVFAKDEQKDRDRHKDLTKHKLTFTECVLALCISIACVGMIAVFLVLEIHYIIEGGVSEPFLGLILVPLVEKFSEHMTAIDEAYDQMPNVALAHVLGASIQTALLNTPIAVMVGWGLEQAGKLDTPMDLNFKPFDAIALILAILVVGNFLRDGKTNYLEGALLVLTYVIIAVCAWYFPEQPLGTTEGSPEEGTAHRLLAS